VFDQGGYGFFGERWPGRLGWS